MNFWNRETVIQVFGYPVRWYNQGWLTWDWAVLYVHLPHIADCISEFLLVSQRDQEENSLLPPFLGRAHSLSLHYPHSKVGMNMLLFSEFWGWFYLLRWLWRFIKSQHSAIGENISSSLRAHPCKLASGHKFVRACKGALGGLWSLVTHGTEVM